MDLDETDIENMKLVMEAATDLVVTFNGKPKEEWQELDFATTLGALDYMKFIVSGIMYSNGLSKCVCGECGECGDDDGPE